MANLDELAAAEPQDEIAAHLAKLSASEPPPPVAAKPSWARRLVDYTSDALPVAGAAVGGIAGAGTGPGALVTIPAGGALGGLAGAQLKRLVDYASGRDRSFTKDPILGDTLFPHAPGDDAARGAGDAMKQFMAGQVLGAASKSIGSQMDRIGGQAPLAAQLRGGATPFANLSDPAFRQVYDASGKPAPIAMAAPRGDLAETGAKFASPQVAEAGMRGAQTLKRIGAPLAEDAAIGRAGARGYAVSSAAQDVLAAGDAELLEAKAKAIEQIRDALPGQTGIDASTEPPTLAVARPGEKLVNKAFNEPDAVNAMMAPTAAPARAALANVKRIGVEQGALGDLRSGGLKEAATAVAQGLTPEVTSRAASDAAELEALSRSVSRQRGGIQQQGPSGFLPRTIYETQKLVAGPRSTMGGIRAETPEDAMLSNTPRLAEIEASRRGWPSQNPGVRDAALNGLPRQGLGKAAARMQAVTPEEQQMAGTILQQFLAKVKGGEPQQQ